MIIILLEKTKVNKFIRRIKVDSISEPQFPPHVPQINHPHLLTKIQSSTTNRTTQVRLTPVINALLVVSVLARSRPHSILLLEFHQTDRTCFVIRVFMRQLSRTFETTRLKILAFSAVFCYRHEHIQNCYIVVSAVLVVYLRVLSSSLLEDLPHRIINIYSLVLFFYILDSDVIQHQPKDEHENERSKQNDESALIRGLQVVLMSHFNS